MGRVLIITTAACTGFCFAYDADDITQNALRDGEKLYNSMERWKARGCDGTAVIHDSVEQAIEAHNSEYEDQVADLDGLLDFYREDGDGGTIETEWVKKVLSDESVDFMEYAEHMIG